MFTFNISCKTISAVIKWLEHEADHSALSSAKLKDIYGAVTPLPDTSPWTILPLIYPCLLNPPPISAFFFFLHSVVMCSSLRKEIVVTPFRKTVYL